MFLCIALSNYCFSFLCLWTECLFASVSVYLHWLIVLFLTVFGFRVNSCYRFWLAVSIRSSFLSDFYRFLVGITVNLNRKSKKKPMKIRELQIKLYCIVSPVKIWSLKTQKKHFLFLFFDSFGLVFGCLFCTASMTLGFYFFLLFYFSDPCACAWMSVLLYTFPHTWCLFFFMFLIIPFVFSLLSCAWLDIKTRLS